MGMTYYRLEVFGAQSLGKMMFKYQITRQDGSPATRDQLVKRWGYKQVPQALFIVAAVRCSASSRSSAGSRPWRSSPAP
jgi:hypothetical protein